MDETKKKGGGEGRVVEDVVGCHVEDAVTFWAQVIRNNDILKLSHALAEVCPQANSVFGNPDFTKIYGGCFSEDKCWYRCKVQQVISDEKCQVLYIDYGNSEILNRSEIVEIPENLQFPNIAKKYRLWGLQIPPDQDLNQFDQVSYRLLNVWMMNCVTNKAKLSTSFFIQTIFHP
uniref:Serine/threonine kinase 31 n=1 Tax=Terrapene triunguis TaxID=2587831 RepID=A0A674IAR2_9SAUR